MREIRLSGSEGGGDEFNRPSLPLSEGSQPRPFQAGVQSASITISLEAVSTAFFAKPAGVYAGITDRLISDV